MMLRLVWITAIALCMLAVGLKVARPHGAMPLYLAFEPALAIFSTIVPDTAPADPKSPQPNLGRVRFGAGDVCCPGIPARNTVNIATGEVMKTH